MAKAKGLVASIATVIVVGAVAAYWYFSPYLDLRQMTKAVEEKDADAFNDHVDYGKLRESMKGQLSAKMAAAMPKENSDNPFAGLGAMIGLGLVNQMVDAMVRPEFVMRAMNEGKLSTPRPSGDQGGADAQSPQKPAQWEFVRKGANRLIAYPKDSQRPLSVAERPGFVFERYGFA